MGTGGWSLERQEQIYSMAGYGAGRARIKQRWREAPENLEEKKEDTKMKKALRS